MCEARLDYYTQQFLPRQHQHQCNKFQIPGGEGDPDKLKTLIFTISIIIIITINIRYIKRILRRLKLKTVDTFTAYFYL